METLDYQQQAIDFLNATNTSFSAKYLTHDYHFDGDTERRDIYRITLKNDLYTYHFNFGQSLNNSGVKKIVPTPYDVLACLQKYHPGEYSDFLSEFGYGYGNSSKRIYNAVVEEFEALEKLFTAEQIELLQEIN